MTLEEKVGQLFMTYVYGRNVEDRSPQAMAANRQAHGVATGRELLRRFHLGGIVYTSWSGNTINPRQIARLSNGIQRVSAHEGARLPALVATDQEGGVVARVGHPATSFPGNMALGAARSPAAARAAARAMGEELRALGINQNLAPVADVNRDPDNPVIGLRSFGSHPRLVSLLTAAQVNGYQEDAGIAATAKHFPGHGDTDTDSHAGLPVIRHTRAEVEQLDLRPFKAAIRAGVGAIMTAHIRVPVLDDSGRPATLSRPILSGVLRRELGFDGVIVTDALNMAGVRSPLGVERVPEEAIRAGADLLLLPPDIDVAYHAVLGAVRGSRISEARIDRSVRRILHLKATLGLLDDPYVEVSSAARSLGTASHRRAAAHVAEKSVTLLRNAGGLLPLMHPARRRVLVVGGEHHAVTSLTRRLAARGVRVDPLVTGSSPGAGQITEALRRLATDYDLAVVLASGARLHAGQGQLVRALAGTDKPVVGVAVAEPYDSAALTGADAVLATYDPGDKAMKALARVLLGDVRPSGRLPVSIPGGDGTTLYPFGHGLRYGR
jgi:beta-N-acetylhexosaminidase